MTFIEKFTNSFFVKGFWDITNKFFTETNFAYFSIIIEWLPMFPSEEADLKNIFSKCEICIREDVSNILRIAEGDFSSRLSALPRLSLAQREQF